MYYEYEDDDSIVQMAAPGSLLKWLIVSFISVLAFGLFFSIPALKKEMFGLGKVSNLFSLFMKSKGSKFCMSVYHHIRPVPISSDFPGKRPKLVFFCFHRVTKTHQDKIAA